ncbi:hypothetical protein MLD38_006690 [Melastoma candidum]|nr:hypothetical protein MLD38_006690 [Melastoma candidum]
MVMFYECSCHDQEGREEKKFYMIDVVKRKGGNVDIKTTIKCLDEEDVIEGDSDGSPDVKTGKQQGFKLLGRLWREITIPGVHSIVSFAFPFRDQKKV